MRGESQSESETVDEKQTASFEDGIVQVGFSPVQPYLAMRRQDYPLSLLIPHCQLLLTEAEAEELEAVEEVGVICCCIYLHHSACSRNIVVRSLSATSDLLS